MSGPQPPVSDGFVKIERDASGDWPGWYKRIADGTHARTFSASAHEEDNNDHVPFRSGQPRVPDFIRDTWTEYRFGPIPATCEEDTLDNPPPPPSSEPGLPRPEDLYQGPNISIGATLVAAGLMDQDGTWIVSEPWTDAFMGQDGRS